MAEVEAQGFFIGRDTNRIECSVWIGFPLSSLSKDNLFACGLDSTKSVAVKLVFTDPPVYGSKCPTVEDKHIFIRQTTKCDFSNLGLSECEPFGLWWTLEQRLSKHLQESWSEIAIEHQTRMDSLREKEKLASTKNVEHIMEIHAVKRVVAEQALIRSNNHLDCAMELLLDEKEKKALVAAARSLSKSCEPKDCNLLIRCLNCVRHRIEECVKYCLVCDKPHPLQLLKPTVCSHELCNFQLTNMGLGINVETEIVKSPEACDLLISMTTGASYSGRHFEPFPTVEAVITDESGKPTKVLFDRDRPQEVGDVLQKCPSIVMMVDMVKRGELREKLEAIHPLLYKLLRWIMATNRCHLHYVTDNSMRVDGVQTEHQFILRSAPPEKERRFKHLKVLHRDSFCAFHGSGLGNWHAILRLGLKNFSGTEKQSHGAMYGPGIYMAVDAATALFYAAYGHVGQGWKHSQFGASARCIAVCEVINYGHPDGRNCTGQLHRPNCKHSSNSPHYRVENEEFVVTRYLLIYNTKLLPNHVLAKNLKIPKNAIV
eukprot:GGOE01062037.1.p1 GENE.GGOE01062037.1~~GGOE01062037.1.p1  ORF type:complete len:591 (-),score=116.96 GGOE01062037.1:104-1732(-)